MLTLTTSKCLPTFNSCCHTFYRLSSPLQQPPECWQPSHLSAAYPFMNSVSITIATFSTHPQPPPLCSPLGLKAAASCNPHYYGPWTVSQLWTLVPVLYCLSFVKYITFFFFKFTLHVTLVTNSFIQTMQSKSVLKCSKSTYMFMLHKFNWATLHHGVISS